MRPSQWGILGVSWEGIDNVRQGQRMLGGKKSRCSKRAMGFLFRRGCPVGGLCLGTARSNPPLPLECPCPWLEFFAQVRLDADTKISPDLSLAFFTVRCVRCARCAAPAAAVAAAAPAAEARASERASSFAASTSHWVLQGVIQGTWPLALRLTPAICPSACAVLTTSPLRCSTSCGRSSRRGRWGLGLGLGLGRKHGKPKTGEGKGPACNTYSPARPPTHLPSRPPRGLAVAGHFTYVPLNRRPPAHRCPSHHSPP